MFDGLLKGKFYSKCKSDLKLTRTRIEMIKKKRNAVQKYLRNDVADLLRNGLDTNAYGRVEGLIAEQNRTSCYEFIDQSCEHLSKLVSAMNKQRECPEECREAASSLMFAAARFADLPELRELRTIFSERYGNSLDCYVNKQFAEKLKSGLPSKDMKLQLLQEIAAESELEWNSKALENKLFNESTYNKDFAKENEDSKHSVTKKDELHQPNQFVPDKKKEVPYNEPKEAIRNEERFPRKKEIVRREVPPVKDIEIDTIVRIEKPNEKASARKAQEKEDEDKPLKYSSIPPPYTKSEVNKPKEEMEESTKIVEKDEKANKPMPRSVRRRNLGPLPGRENSGSSEGDEQERNKEKAAQGQRILKFFDNGGTDEEEKMMDKLLRHYSRKNGSTHEKGKLDLGRKSHNGPRRSSSLPLESASPTETSKKHTRTASLQPELLNSNPHVHPKLPDYDDFVARLAAYRGH